MFNLLPSFFFTSADNLEPGAVFVHGPGGALLAEVALGVGVLQAGDVLHALPQGLQHNGDLDKQSHHFRVEF